MDRKTHKHTFIVLLFTFQIILRHEHNISSEKFGNIHQGDIDIGTVEKLRTFVTFLIEEVNFAYWMFLDTLEALCGFYDLWVNIQLTVYI